MTSPASPGFVGQNSTPLSGFKRGLFSRLSRRSLPQTQADIPKTNVHQSADGNSRPSLDFQSDLSSFQSLWRDAVTVMNEPGHVPERRNSTTPDSCETVIGYTSQMVKILTRKGVMGDLRPNTSECDSRILDYFYSEDVLVKLLDWASHRPEFDCRLRLHLLGLFDAILGQRSCQFFMDRQILKPLFQLITSCSETRDVKDFEERLAVVFNHICFGISQYSEVLEALFGEACVSSDAGGHTLISSLLLYIHWDGLVGQQARDALQVVICLSSTHEEVSHYIVSISNFCPVLAAGLTGLYSSLPRKLSYSSDDWSGISEEDIRSSPDLQRFLTSLTFCNDIVKVSPPAIRQRLLEFIYNGFLVPVIAPGLHQESLHLPPSLCEFSWLGGASGLDEVIASTAYLNLFLTKITEPDLLRIFLHFILLVKVDELSILDLLIKRISNQQTKLCVVTLVLFRSLVELNCEDVMYHLVFKYLLPCTHVMVSQQRSIADVDLYCRNAEKLLSLIPECCYIDASQNQSSPSVTPSRSDSLSQFERSKWWQSIRRKKTPSNNLAESFNGSPATTLPRSSVGDIGSQILAVDPLETSYVEYLRTARLCLDRCKRACRNWALTYDGRNATCSLATDGSRSPAENQLKRISVLNFDEGAVLATCSKKVTACAAGFEHHQLDASSGAVAEPAVVSSASGLVHGMHCGDNTLQGLSAGESSVLGTSVAENSVLGTSTAADSLWAASGVMGGRMGLGCFRDLGRTSPLSGVSSGASGPSKGDLNTFLMQLSRVQAPESESRLEEVLGELDSLLMEAENRRIASFRMATLSENALTGVSEVNPNPVFSEQVAGTVPQVVVAVSSEPSAVSNVISSGLETVGEPASIERRNLENPDVLRSTGLELPIPDGRRGQLLLSSSSSSKNSASSPTVGPFLTTLLQKLEVMRTNTFYVNLHLTGLLSRLACYPQPLLQSLLLSQTLVFQPSIKSLAQVLNFVKCRLDEYFLTVPEKDLMMIQAQQYLRYRDGRMHNDARMSLGDIRVSSPTAKVTPSKQPRLTLLGNRHGARYMPQSPTAGSAPLTQDSPEFMEKKNAIYCALILKEFLKELAAISQENTVL